MRRVRQMAQLTVSEINDVDPSRAGCGKARRRSRQITASPEPLDQRLEALELKRRRGVPFEGRDCK
jgi:hypothetical protein